HGVKAPAVSGHEEFERMFRIHMNTLEQLVIFLPGLWLFALYVNPLIAAGIGLVFIIGRFVYRASYLVDPGKRSMGFALGALPMMVLVIGGMIGALLQII
ncbi:MAG: MAPEG family protein, partial [Woeseia sp.]